MKIGLFDHVDRSDRSLAEQLDERFQLIAAADEAGYYCYHIAEHHATPLNMVPRPGVYMGAIARLTRQIKMGPMVYLLPLHSPLQVAEEICILDHLSHGRMEVGVGRGVSPFELNFHKIDPERSREIFFDAFACLDKALTHDRLDHHGEFYDYTDVPVPLKPYQQPRPAYWYGSSNVIGSTWAGEQGMHFATNGSITRAKTNIDAFRAALTKRGGAAQPKPEFSGGVAIGVSREIIVAPTDAEALRIAAPAHDHIYQNQNYLRREHAAGRGGTLVVAPGHVPTRASTLEDAIREGTTIVGSPTTVRAEIEKQVAELGINYLIGYFMFGTMALKDALRSLELFTTEVKPHLEHL
jgi:alkanesulfonate monooxygenase SsuD/methylene tetrahydromethanopterin reductase-like flavin-dependent oxidoreductase (luciferase family)